LGRKQLSVESVEQRRDRSHAEDAEGEHRRESEAALERVGARDGRRRHPVDQERSALAPDEIEQPPGQEDPRHREDGGDAHR